MSFVVFLCFVFQAFIDKFRYNAKRASLVQSRLKTLEKLYDILQFACFAFFVVVVVVVVVVVCGVCLFIFLAHSPKRYYLFV